MLQIRISYLEIPLLSHMKVTQYLCWITHAIRYRQLLQLARILKLSRNEHYTPFQANVMNERQHPSIFIFLSYFHDRLDSRTIKAYKYINCHQEGKCV